MKRSKAFTHSMFLTEAFKCFPIICYYKKRVFHDLFQAQPTKTFPQEIKKTSTTKNKMWYCKNKVTSSK